MENVNFKELVEWRECFAHCILDLTLVCVVLIALVCESFGLLFIAGFIWSCSGVLRIIDYMRLLYDDEFYEEAVKEYVEI